MRPRSITRVLLVSGALALSACGGTSQQAGQSSQTPDLGAAQPQPQQSVSFDLNLSALLEKEVIPGTFNDASANLVQGTMQVTNLATGDVEQFPWTVNIDESDLRNVQSFQTLTLPPGDYAFELALNKATHSYAGSTVHTVTDGATDQVDMTIRPIIGDSQVDVNVVSELIDLRFSYSEAELNTANLSNPSVGITIGGNPEQIFLLDPVSGLSEPMLLSLPPGQYDISLRLLDSGIQVGKSIAEQEQNITVTQGLDVSMDIAPLHGEFALALDIEGADATLNLQVPPEVVEEVGDIAQLQTTLSVTGPSFPLHEQSLNLTPAGPAYIATTTLVDVVYGELTFEMTFTDLSDGSEVGYCVNSIVLSNTNASLECDLTLRRRQIVSGSLMSTLGINVTAPNGAPVPGAVVSIDGVDVAITNSAAFSTEGYSKVYVRPGTYTVRAQQGAAFGEASYESVPLGVDNVSIVLDQFDTDGDGVVDSADACPTIAGNTDNGCPSNLAADLLVGKAGEAGHLGQVTLKLNDGTGSFTDVAETFGQGSHHTVAAGDLNQDGVDDVAALRSDGAVLVALGPFTNTLSLVQVGTKSDQSRGIEVGDVNNDNIPDLITMGHLQHAAFLGNGDGSFGPEMPFAAVGGDNRYFDIGDFDQDGNLDVTINSHTGSCVLAIHYGDGTGNFTSDASHAHSGLLTNGALTADFDADGDLDIVTGGYGYGARIFYNNGNRNFTAGPQLYDPEAFVYADDFNNNGAADLITTDMAGALFVRLNDGSGNFGTAATYSGAPGTRSAVTFDVNNDGMKDVAIVNALVFGDVAASNNITIMPGNGDGTFQPAYNIPGYRNNMPLATGNFD